MLRAGLDELQLANPDGLVRSGALMALLRCAKERSRDPGLGLKLACLMDLRQQGFWGYAVLSGANLRERVEAHLRYQRLRAPWQIAVRVEAGTAVLELIPVHIPSDLLPIVIEWIVATALLHLADHLGQRLQGVELLLSYGARPHHRELGELFQGVIRFDAPCNALRVPAELLNIPLPGDPHLQRLARGQLDAQLNALQSEAPRSLVEQVRERLAARLDGDASLVRIALDLNMNARTLQRQLDAEQMSFQKLLDEARHAQAIKLLSDPAWRVGELATRMGYADAASFRRAFRRWTGLTPARFRAQCAAAPVTEIVSRSSRKVSGA
jgi:AraC-like DNA-binding protein